MSVFLRIDINVAAVIFLGTILVIAYGRLDRRDKLNKAFLRISSIILLQLIFETITCIINKRTEIWLIPVAVLLHICLFISGPFLSYLWYNLIKKLVFPNNNTLQGKDILLFIPVIINFFLTVLSPIFRFVFYIDSANVYHRGQLFAVAAAITYFYIVYSFILIVINRKRIITQEFVPLFAFGIFPILGGLVQSIFYGPLLMWSSTAFSLTIVYVFLQQRMVHLDSLTGTWSRGSFDYYISQRLMLKSDDTFGVIYIDIDGLKDINDKYGHAEGDVAIQTSVRLIKSVLRKNDIIARLGGDEFIIILDGVAKDVLEKTIERLELSFMHYNKRSSKDYELGCSFGADIFNSQYKSIEQFLHHVDDLMYNNKREKKHLDMHQI